MSIKYNETKHNEDTGGETFVEPIVKASELEVDSKPAQDEINEDLPREQQCEVVDMDDKNMDPLEWSVRKTVPIPNQYYFDTGNYDVSLRTKAWHRSVQAAGITIRAVEAVGGFFAGMLGLTNSRYDDVISYMTEEEIKQSLASAKESKEKRRQYLKEKEIQNSRINAV